MNIAVKLHAAGKRMKNNSHINYDGLDLSLTYYKYKKYQLLKGEGYMSEVYWKMRPYLLEADVADESKATESYSGQAKPRLVLNHDEIGSNNMTPQSNYIENNYFQVMISSETALFIKVLTGGENYRYYVLQGFLKNLFTVKTENLALRACLFLYGPRAIGKDILVALAKNLCAHPTRVQEFNPNSFIVDQLEYCELLLIPDLVTLTKTHITVLKNILSRDPITLKSRFDKTIGKVSPYCQVIIVSNHSPDYFEELINDPTISSKIIRYQFQEKEKFELLINYQETSKKIIRYQLKEEEIFDHKTAAFEIKTVAFEIQELLDKHIIGITNWLLSATPRLLEFHMQALQYQAEAPRRKLKKGVASFLSETYWYDNDPKQFVSIGDLNCSYNKYESTFNNNENENNKPCLKLNHLIATESQVFGKVLVYKKRSTFGSSLGGAGRPFGFYNLRLKSLNESPPLGCASFNLAIISNTSEFKDPFMASKEITWYPSDPFDSTSVQEHVLRACENKKLFNNIKKEDEAFDV